MSVPIIWLTPGLAHSASLAEHPVWLGEQALSFAEALAGIQGPLTLVLAAGDVLCAEASLTRQQARHLRKILPFVLEDQLATPVDEQEIIAGPGRDGCYPLAVVNRELLNTLLAYVREHQQVEVDVITVDLWLLAETATDSSYQQGAWQLLRETAFSGVWVEAEQFEQWAALAGQSAAPSPAALMPALHQGLPRAASLNFIQGAYVAHSSWQTFTLPAVWQRLSVALAAMLVLWVGSLYLFGWFYQQAATTAWQQAGAHYNRLFPDDAATVMLESQFRRRLAALQGGAAGGQEFLQAMSQLENSFSTSAGWVAKRLSYDERDHGVNLDVEAAQYEQLETLRQALQEQGAQAEMANFRNQGERVSARIRLQLGVSP